MLHELRLLLFVLLAAFAFAQEANVKKPPPFRQVTSTHGGFEYAIPADWKKDGFNSYRGPDGSLIEQIYPRAIITAEYCSGAGWTVAQPYEESKVYDNGDVRGCYIMRRFGKYRHISFRFPSPSGIEDITIIMPQDTYDTARVKKIIDSVRLK